MSKSKSFKYKAKPGSFINDEQADLIGRTLETMEREGVATTPENFVERARKTGGDLGSLFNWDRDAAAHAHWLAHARKLIQSVHVIEFRQKESKRAFFSVPVQTHSGDRKQQYVSRRTVMLDMTDELAQVSAASYKRISAEIETIVGLGLHKRDPGWAKIVEVLQLYAPNTASIEA